jgi:hypothetical protein
MFAWHIDKVVSIAKPPFIFFKIVVVRMRRVTIARLIALTETFSGNFDWCLAVNLNKVEVVGARQASEWFEIILSPENAFNDAGLTGLY